MRSVEAILCDNTSENEDAGRVYPQLVSNFSQHIIELDLNALEQAGPWGVARVEIEGKTYHLFPAESG